MVPSRRGWRADLHEDFVDDLRDLAGMVSGSDW